MVPDVIDPLIVEDHSRPAAVMNGRPASLRRHHGFLQERRLSVVPEYGHGIVSPLLQWRAGAGQHLLEGFSLECLLVRIPFRDGRAGLAAQHKAGHEEA